MVCMNSPDLHTPDLTPLTKPDEMEETRYLIAYSCFFCDDCGCDHLIGKLRADAVSDNPIRMVQDFTEPPEAEQNIPQFYIWYSDFFCPDCGCDHLIQALRKEAMDDYDRLMTECEQRGYTLLGEDG